MKYRLKCRIGKAIRIGSGLRYYFFEILSLLNNFALCFLHPDVGVLEAGHWDVEVEYAKGSPNSILMVITVTNRGPKEDTLHVLPTLW